MDAVTLGTILSGFLSSQNDVRKNAEATFKSLKQQQPAVLARLLLEIMSTSTNSTLRQQSALSFRNVYREFCLGETSNAWSQLDEATQESFKSKLLDCLKQETDPTAKRAIGNAVAELADAIVMSQKSWVEVFAVIQQLIGGTDSLSQVIGLELAADLEPHMSDDFQRNIASLKEMLAAKFSSNDEDIITAATALWCQVVMNEDTVSRELACFIEPVIKIVATTSSESLASNILKELIQIALDAPFFFKSTASDVMPFMLNVAKEKEEIRELSLEFLMTYVDSKYKNVVKIPGFLPSLVDALMTLLMDVEEDPMWFDAENKDLEEENHELGESYMDRLAGTVESEVIMPLIFDKVGQYVTQADWRCKVAGISAVCQSIEYLSADYAIKQLPEIVRIVVAATKDAHYRVRYSACRTIAQIALDHMPFVQENCYAQVLPALIERFDDPIARVQKQAFTAFVNFAEEVDIEDLLPFVPVVMDKVNTRLDGAFKMAGDEELKPEIVLARHNMIREQCVTSVAVVAGVLRDQFLEFCPRIVPLMKLIVAQADTEEMQPMRGRALECLSIIAYSVGFSHIEAEAQQIVNALIALYKTERKPDDPVTDYIYEALRRMTTVMGRNFSQFNSELVPIVVSRLKDVEKVPVDPEFDEYNDMSVVNERAGRAVYSGVKTSKLELMHKDLELLISVIENTKGHFAPHIQTSLEAIVPLLELKHSDDVRKSSLMAMAELIGAARDGQAPSDQLTQWVMNAMRIVLQVVDDSEELHYSGVDHLTAVVSGLARCIENAGKGILDASQIEMVIKCVWKMIGTSSTRRQQMSKYQSDGELEEEEQARWDDEKEREQVFRETCLKVMESCIRTHPDEFLQSGSKITMEHVEAFMAVPDADDRALACYACCDLLQILGSRGLSLIGNKIEKLVWYIEDQNESVRQAACFAMNLCMNTQGIHQALVTETATRLLKVIQHADAWRRVNRSATENAVSALVSIVLHQSEVAGQARVTEFVDLILASLPIIQDVEEGRLVHDKIVKDLLNGPQSAFWGTNNSNLPKIVPFIAHIYRSQYVEDDTNPLIRQLAQKIGVAAISEVVANQQLTEYQQRGLKKIERDFTN